MARQPNFRFGISICVAMLAATCGGAAQALQGGSPSRGGDQLSRATVAIGTVSQGGGGFRISRCSGVLIGADLVMTAAHCVRGDALGAVVFFYDAGVPNPSPYAVASVVRYPVRPGRLPAADFAGRLNDLALDVAVLRLAAPVAGRRPLALAGSQQLPAKLQLAGVGLSGQGAGSLRTTALQPLLVTETGLTIANVLGGQVCLGDSGGPVVIPSRRGPLLVGVTSAVVAPRAPCGRIVVIAPATLGGGRS